MADCNYVGTCGLSLSQLIIGSSEGTVKLVDEYGRVLDTTRYKASILGFSEEKLSACTNTRFADIELYNMEGQRIDSLSISLNGGLG